MKFLGEGEWKRKKYGPEYRRQWRKLHIGIDAKTLQIRAVQNDRYINQGGQFLNAIRGSFLHCR